MNLIDDIQALDELEEDEASKLDEPDSEPILEHRRIFTEKLDPPVGEHEKSSTVSSVSLRCFASWITSFR